MPDEQDPQAEIEGEGEDDDTSLPASGDDSVDLGSVLAGDGSAETGPDLLDEDGEEADDGDAATSDLDEEPDELDELDDSSFVADAEESEAVEYRALAFDHATDDEPAPSYAWHEQENSDDEAEDDDGDEPDDDDWGTFAPPAPVIDYRRALSWGSAETDDGEDEDDEAIEEEEAPPAALLFPPLDPPGDDLEELDELEDFDDLEVIEETPPDLPPLVTRIATEPPAPPPLGPVPYTPPLPEDLEPMLAPLVPAPEGVATDDEPEEVVEERPLRRQAIPINALVIVLTAVGTAICLGFLLIEPSPRWLLLAGAIAVIFGMDGVLRGTWGEPFASEGDTTPNLFLPALYILAGPMIVEHNIPGYAALPAGLLLGAGFGVIVVGELISVRTGAPEYPVARLIETVASYFVLFALLSLTYVFDINLTMALLATAILTLMLGLEVLRQGEIDPMETLLLAIVSALILVEARWLLHYLPLDGYLAGLTLTLVFFLTTGLLHAYVERQFDSALVLEYATIAAAGVALVTAAHMTGLA